MVQTHEQQIEFENIKQKHKAELMELANVYGIAEHERNLKELDVQLEIAKAKNVIN